MYVHVYEQYVVISLCCSTLVLHIIKSGKKIKHEIQLLICFYILMYISVVYFSQKNNYKNYIELFGK